ncbi:unnamed protein product [Brachionus calyciflorus]|uniref:Uncharacterized protein n=1 Tax=Brachionus calyciflorus TaxID=104777 RepID=A0A813TXN3_9BILA|nr:unnamed protein product [Brachionus calyciflorus]
MNSNILNLIPHLIPIEKETNSNVSKSQQDTWVTFKGFIDIFNESYYINLEASMLEEDNKIEYIKIDCDPALNNLIINIKVILEQRLAKCESIKDFIHELKNLIECNLKKSHDEQSSQQNIEFLNSIDFYKRVVSEIDRIGWRNLVKVNETFTELVFEYEENSRVHEITIILTETFPKIEPMFRTELPTKFSFDWNQNSTLLEVYSQFMADVDSFSTFWDEMKMLDENCWILEPLKPTKTDCHRRIKLNAYVSIQIKIDPRNPRELPEIIFLGSEASTETFRDKFESKFNEWNSNISILYNLGELLEIKLPNKCEQEEEEIGIECGICYSFLLNNQGPSLYCETQSCNKPFHEQCLHEWLKNSTNCKIYFGFMFGSCPYCSESIKCKIMADQ